MPVVTQLSISDRFLFIFFQLLYNVKCVHIILLHTACGVICWSSTFIYLFCSRPLLMRNFSLCWQRRWRNCWNWWVRAASFCCRGWMLFCVACKICMLVLKKILHKKIRCLYFWSLHYRFGNILCFVFCFLIFFLRVKKRSFFSCMDMYFCQSVTYGSLCMHTCVSGTIYNSKTFYAERGIPHLHMVAPVNVGEKQRCLFRTWIPGLRSHGLLVNFMCLVSTFALI